jgi:hypothetical protein
MKVPPNSTLAITGQSSITVVREPRPSKMLTPKNAFRSWWSVYEAAERADFRGYFYLPTLNPGEQLNSLTASAIRERIDFLYKNVAPVTVAIDGLAVEEAGTGSWPKWITSSPDFNKAITDAFHYAFHDPRIFSADGETDYYGSQVTIRRMIRLYGDGFGQFLRPAPGNIFPQCALIPGWRVENGSQQKGDPRWREGILRNALGRRLSVSVLAPSGLSGDFAPQVDSQVVAADDMLHFHDMFLPGQNRGVSSLAPVVKKMFRREDIGKALANGTLARERLGFALEMKDEDMGPIAAEGEGDEQVVQNADGTEFTLRRFFGPDAGEEIEVPRLPNGAKIATIESNRPGTAVMEFQDSILRELAWATLYPPEYMFFLAGMGQGTVARLVLQRVEALKRFRRANQLFPQFCNRWNVYAAWQMILAGIFDDINIPDDWWKHKIHSDADKSVDIGREGRLYDDRVATNKMSIDDYHALAGADAGDVDESNMARIKERIMMLNKLNADPELQKAGIQFTYYDLWPRSINAATPPPTEEQTSEIPPNPYPPDPPPRPKK